MIINRNEKTIICFSFVMLVIKIFDLLISPNHVFEGRIAVFSWLELAAVFIVGMIAAKISGKTEIPEMWDKGISNRKRIAFPFLSGLIIGLVFAIFDSFLKIGDISVGWPLSPAFYLWGAISQEILVHFFPMVLLLWIFAGKIFKGRYFKQTYRIIALLISLVSAIGMVGAFGNPMIPLTARYFFVPYLIGALVFSAEMILFEFMKKYGLISSFFARYGFYFVWHIFWPLIFY